ncbi:Uncharacterised protein [uncultured archaeon]|nr:Uncharacterised protein [uncultured archaeon]
MNLKFMTKTMRDFLLEGGIKGKRFIDERYIAPRRLIYEVKNIGGGGHKGEFSANIVGEIISPQGVESSYTNSLINCLDHQLYEE